MEITLLSLGMRYVGVKELSTSMHDHPLIQWWLSLCGYGLEANDEVPWCSAFVNGMAWELSLTRSKSAAARSWLEYGQVVLLDDAQAGWDIVILKRGVGPQPGPEVINAPGHVGILAGISHGEGSWPVHILGGNQGNQVSIQAFERSQVLGVRRLWP